MGSKSSSWDSEYWLFFEAGLNWRVFSMMDHESSMEQIIIPKLLNLIFSDILWGIPWSLTIIWGDQPAGTGRYNLPRIITGANLAKLPMILEDVANHWLHFETTCHFTTTWPFVSKMIFCYILGRGWNGLLGFLDCWKCLEKVKHNFPNAC